MTLARQERSSSLMEVTAKSVNEDELSNESELEWSDASGPASDAEKGPMASLRKFRLVATIATNP